MKKKIIICILVLITFLSVYKLDYKSLYVDEIVYINAGIEYYKKHDYSLNREVPPVGKYIAGLFALPDERNVFFMRLPFALMLPLATYFVYLIVNKFYDKKLSLFAALLFGVMPFATLDTRMVMLEPPIILFWLIFHYWFLDWLFNKKPRSLVLAGIFLGISLGTKIPSLILIPFIFLILLITRNLKLKNLLTISIPAIGTYFLIFLPVIIKEGANGYLNHVRAMYDDYFVERDQKGKAHIVDGIVYQKSPAWYYLHFIKERYNPLLLASTLISPIAPLVEKSLFTIYWGVFFIFSFGFIQALSVKQDRYINYIEIPIIFLITIVFNYFIRHSKKLGYSLLLITVGLTLGARISFAYNETPSGYNALYKSLAQRTDNFTNGERIYMYGSIRTSRWYFVSLPEDLFVSRKDWGPLAADFKTFKYIVFDKAELAKVPDNKFYDYVIQRDIYYNKEDFQNFYIYTFKGDLQVLKPIQQ